MSSERLRPTMEVEPATPADILDGLETLEGRSGQGTLVIPPGDGPDRFLNWALQEVTNARQSASEEQEHHCVDAVLNARRSLACLGGLVRSARPCDALQGCARNRETAG